MFKRIKHVIIHFSHYLASDWLTAYSQFSIAFELDRINLLSAEKVADNRFILSSALKVTWQPYVFKMAAARFACIYVYKMYFQFTKCIIKQLLNSVIAKYHDLSVSRYQLFASAADGIGK